MFIKREKLLQGSIIGLCIILCFLILLITIYILYRYKKDKDRKLNIQNDITNNTTIETKEKILQELMRKSFELAKTAEKVADEKEKRISLRDNIYRDL